MACTTSALRNAVSPRRWAAEPALVGLAERRPHGDLAAQREREQEESAKQREHPEPWVQQPDDENEHERPGRIEDRQDAIAADERAQSGEVAQRLGAERAPAERCAEARREHGLGQPSIEPDADPDQRLVPDRLQQTEHQQGKTGEHGQRDQGLDVAARQHAVEHLEHVERRDQDQEIEKQAERGDHAEAMPRFAQGRVQGGRPRLLPGGAARLLPALGRDRTNSLLQEVPDLACRRLALPDIAPAG